MKRRDFIRTTAAIVAASPITTERQSEQAKPIVWPDSDEIKMENTWARWSDNPSEPASRTGECFAWGMDQLGKRPHV